MFRAFHACPYEDIKVVFLGQDPYPQKGYATGLAFANPKDIPKLSPSLEVLMEVIYRDYHCRRDLGGDDVGSMEEFRNYFDISLMPWAKQGVLLLNTALSVVFNTPDSHSDLWYAFMKEFITNLSYNKPELVWVLFGNRAKDFNCHIKNGHVIKENHPAYYARQGKTMKRNVFESVNVFLMLRNKIKIEWYEDRREK